MNVCQSHAEIMNITVTHRRSIFGRCVFQQHDDTAKKLPHCRVCVLLHRSVKHDGMMRACACIFQACVSHVCIFMRMCVCVCVCMCVCVCVCVCCVCTHPHCVIVTMHAQTRAVLFRSSQGLPTQSMLGHARQDPDRCTPTHACVTSTTHPHAQGCVNTRTQINIDTHTCASTHACTYDVHVLSIDTYSPTLHAACTPTTEYEHSRAMRMQHASQVSSHTFALALIE